MAEELMGLIYGWFDSGLIVGDRWIQQTLLR